jgi:hypothetical protein
VCGSAGVANTASDLMVFGRGKIPAPTVAAEGRGVNYKE